MDVVIFETDSDTLIEASTLLGTAELAKRCEFHLVLKGTPVEEIIRRTQPRLVITSWRDIGPRVLAAVQELNPKPVVWVMSNYDLRDVQREARYPVEQIFDKYEFVQRLGLPLAVQGFIQRQQSAASAG